MALPSTNITTTLVGNTIGVSTRDVGALCTSPNINMWSKCKPLRISGMPNRSLDWWKAPDGNCGFSVKQISTYLDLPNIIDGIMNGWEYQKPSGGVNSPYRIADFGGYRHDATPFVMNFHVPDVVAANTDFVATCAFNRATSDLLAIENIATVSECYFGVFIKQKNGSSYRRATSQIKIKDGGTSVIFPKYSLTYGEWVAYPFISTDIQTDGVPDIQSIYYTLPNVSGKQMQVVSDFLNIQVLAEVHKFGELVDTDQINYTIQISNLGGGQTFVNNNIMFRFGNKNHADPIIAGESVKSLGDIYVGSGETKTITGWKAGATDIVNSQYGAKVYVLMQSGTKVAEAQVTRPR